MSSHPSLGDMAGIVASSEGILLLLPHRSTEAEREVRLAFERLHAADASASASGEQLRIAVTVGVRVLESLLYLCLSVPLDFISI